MLEQKAVKTAQSNNNASLQSMNLLRYYFNSEEKVLYISMLPSLYQKWNQKGVKHAKKYFDMQIAGLEDRQMSGTPHRHTTEHKNNNESLVFLARNKRKSTLKSMNPKEIRIMNRVSYKVGEC